MSEELKFCPFCKSKQLEVVKIDMKDPGRDLIKCRHCRGRVMRYHWDTRHITKADVEAYLSEHGMKAIRFIPEPPTTMRDLTQEEGEGLCEALKRSTKLIKRRITKADVDTYCRANGLVMIKLDDLKFIAGKCNSGAMVANEYLAAFKEQAL